MKDKIIYLVLVICLLIPTASARWEGTVSDLQITTSYDPSPAEPGNYVRLYIYAYNEGSSTKEDVWFSLEADYPFSIEDNTKYYGEIASGQRITLTYDLWVDIDAPEADYDDKIKFRQCYDNSCSDGPYVDISLPVKQLYPILEIASIELDEDILPGEITQIGLVLNNRGGSRLKDIMVKLNLSSSSLPLAPFGSSTEKIISSIEKNSNKEAVFDLIVDGEAESGLYKIPVTLTYYDSSGNSYTKEDTIGLVIGGKPVFKVGLEEYDYLTSGAIGDVVINIINEGTSDAKFMSVEILPTKEFEVISPKELYIGNLDPDDYETAEFKIKINNVKDSVSIPVKLSYTDVNNNKYTEERTVNLKIYTASEIKALQGGGGSLKWVIIALIVIGGVIYYKKFYKKRKGLKSK